MGVEEITLPCACALGEFCPHLIRITKVPEHTDRVRLGVFKKRLKGDPELLCYFWFSPDSLELAAEFARKETT